ncbi:MAG: hypothetical protein PHW89_08155 [Sulfurimonas denitrificans]|nr:hypothetical protein [Sulfurimonas denitrificans]
MLKRKSGKPIKSAKDIQAHKQLEETFKDGKNASVKVGFPASKSATMSKQDGVTALFKATVNNFGLGVPKRPFMSVAFASNVNKYRKMIAKNIGKMKQRQLLSQIGAVGEGDVKKTIVDFKNPPNSDLTIKIKGTDNPLIDSSHMVGSVSWALEAK